MQTMTKTEGAKAPSNPNAILAVILSYKGFKFDVPMSGAITFKIYFEPGTLPET